MNYPKPVFDESPVKVEPYSVKEIRKNIRLDRRALRARLAELNEAFKIGNTYDQLIAAEAVVEIADLLRSDLQELHETEGEK